MQLPSCMIDNPFSRLLSWIVEPHVFLVLRLAGDFAAAAYLAWIGSYLVAAWFAVVGLFTVWSERKALRSAAGRAPSAEASGPSRP